VKYLSWKKFEILVPDVKYFLEFYDSKLAIRGGYNMAYERMGKGMFVGERKDSSPKLLAYANGFNPQFACSNREASPRDRQARPVVVSVFTQLDSSKLWGKEGWGTSTPWSRTLGSSH
jgi:hypothetical protein